MYSSKNTSFKKASYSVSDCVASCRELQCVQVCSSMLQCVAVRASPFRVCQETHYRSKRIHIPFMTVASWCAFQCVAVCFSILQCVLACCVLLHFVSRLRSISVFLYGIIF